MRIWGYLFIVLNIGAGSAFVYFATQLWKARTEWQLAVVKQQLAIDGLPLEAPPAPPNLEEDSVPFDLQVGETRLQQIRKSILKRAIPRGGKLLGTDDVVADQSTEVKRVEALVLQSLAPEKVKIGEKEFELLTPEKRQRLAVTLLSLTKGYGRLGVYALYRDLPVEGRYEWARKDLAYLGRVDAQISTLTLLVAIGSVQEAITLSLPPDVLNRRVHAARVAVAEWLRAEIPNAAPAPFRSPNAPAPTPETPEAKNEDLPIIEGKLKPLIDSDEDVNDPLNFDLPEVVENVLKAAMKPVEKMKLLQNYPKGYLFKFTTDPDRGMQIRQQIDTAVKELRDQIEADTGVKGESAKQLIPFLADLAANPLDSKEQVAAAKKRLLELLDVRSTSESEKKAYAAIVEVLFTPRPYEQETDDAKAHREKNIDEAGLGMLRAYFEDAADKSAMTAELPKDAALARAKVAALRPLRDPGQKRRDIAHLLYHLDGYLALTIEEKGEKSVTRHIAPRVRWFKLMFPAIAEKDPDDDTLSEEEKKDATTALDELYLQRSEWHQRVAAVVGLTSYVQAIEAQATELAQITVRLKPLIAVEQSYYEKERQDLIYWVIELNRLLEQRRVIDREQEELRKEHESQRDTRIGEQKDLEKNLAQVQGEAKSALKDLDAKVDELFKVTKKLGEAQDALLGLELQLRDIELGRRNKK